MLTFDFDPRAISGMMRKYERRRRELQEATGRALGKRAEHVRGRAIAYSPRNTRGRIARNTTRTKAARTYTGWRVEIRSGGGPTIGRRIGALHGVNVNYSRGQFEWMSRAIREELGSWPNVLGDAIRAELPREWR